MARAKYAVFAELYPRAGKNPSETIYLGRSNTGDQLMVIPNNIEKRGSKAPYLILLRPGPAPQPLHDDERLPIDSKYSNNHSERTLRGVLTNLGYAPRGPNPDMVGQPDFWIKSPNPMIVQFFGCRVHCHHCALIKVDRPSADQTLTRHKTDRENQAFWMARGVPTLIVWECATTGTQALDATELSYRLKQHIENGIGGEIYGE